MNEAANKAEKLAAARKKLKDFQKQQKNKDSSENGINSQQLAIKGETAIILKSFNGKEKTEVQKMCKNDEYLNESLKSISCQQQLPLAQYFENPNKNYYFFDTVHTNSYDGNHDHNLYETNLNEGKPTLQVLNKANYSRNINELMSVGLSTNQNLLTSSQKCDTTTEISKDFKQHLELAENKNKMQAEALDIITAEREDLQLKLENALQMINFHKETALSLKKQLEENKIYQDKLNKTIADLEQFKKNTLNNESNIEGIVNELRKKNDELKESLEMQKEKNSEIQKRFEEQRINSNMLKFQQSEVENNGQSYQIMHEECEILKHKCSELEEQLKAIMFEKEHMVDKYQQYVESQNKELHRTCYELQEMSTENREILNKISSQTNHINYLEKQLQKVSSVESYEKHISDLSIEILNLKKELEKEKMQNESLLSQLTDHSQLKNKMHDLKNELETLKVELTDIKELQMTVESHKVAASQAISQNSKLKAKLEQLNESIVTLSNENATFNRLLQTEKAKNNELTALRNGSPRIDSTIVDKSTVDAETNTLNNYDTPDKNDNKCANFDAMLQLQEKFKCVLNRMANLTDEKQQLEHLVMQLQSETETIEEYVALYQKQRSILQQRARETDFKVEKISKQKEQLQDVLRLILSTNNIDYTYVKQLIKHNVSTELNDELELIENSGTDGREIYPHFYKNEINGHHPSCHCCSGKLITL